jgi:hypothetical protein
MSSEHEHESPAVDPQAPSQPHVETPAEHVAAVQKKKNLYLRITSSMPLLVTVIVHVILVGIAGAVVVQQNIVGKKKTFEASASNEGAAKQIEHRLQVARRGGSSGGASSPVSANRIFSTAAGALSMPEMPDLPSMGAGGFGGFGGMGSGVGLGAGVGMATSLGGGTGLGGRGFMSLSFLGSTSQNASKIVFVVDTHPAIMDPAKGGFQAFSIIREEIMRLVGKLPPSAQFNVVLFSAQSSEYNNVNVNLYSTELVAATSDNKKDFFEWMAPVNSQLNRYGPTSAKRFTPWRRRPIPSDAGIDPNFYPPVWARAAQAALEQKADTIFVITSGAGRPVSRADEATIAKRRAENEKKREEFRKQMQAKGLDPAAISAARDRAYDKAMRELAAANRRLVEQGKDPIVVTDRSRITNPAVQAALKRNGITITLDKTGWTDANGRPYNVPWFGTRENEYESWSDFVAYFARLQRALVPDRATLNVFLFVGPNDKPTEAITNLTTIAKRNGGTFQLLTTKRLEELKSREDEKK